MSQKLIPPVNADDHVQGLPDASIELVEYGDYQCPHCGMAHPVVKKIQKAFEDKLKFVFRHFPLTNIHPYAFPAAVAAEAAGRQHKFWQMHDIIFERQAELSDEAIFEFARDIGLNPEVFRRDLSDRLLTEKVEENFNSGVRSGVNGTPSFFINGYKYNGNYDYASLYSAIEESVEPAF